ncbi:MAG: cytochrome c [Chthoniobacterales bacterium]
MSLENNNSNDEEFREAELSSEMNVGEVHGSILQEKKDSHVGYEPIPVWLIAIFIAIIFWAGSYLSFYSGGFKADVFDANIVSWAGGGAGQQAGPPDPMVVGKRVFSQNCVVCHQQTGLGVAGQFPPLVGSEWVMSQDWHGDNHLVKIVLMGMQGPVTVKGIPFNGAMPPWNQLKDEQIAAVLTYVRNEWGNKALPISADNVKQIREELKGMGRSEPWSQADLQKIPKQIFTPAADSAPAPGAAPAAPKAVTPPAPQA